jgi:cytochrome c oxidase assembly protein subunit 15
MDALQARFAPGERRTIRATHEGSRPLTQTPTQTLTQTLSLAGEEGSAPHRARRAVRIWLLAMAALIVAMVLVGGATRLTESGLSIVEWKPVTGALPPLNDAQWQAAFDAYKTIPQYQQVNRGMSLADFKTIFWWEWSHRLLGRVIGAAFLLPFLWFLARGELTARLTWRLAAIFVLGGAQGAIGWWMVASGLTGRVEVSQYRLAVHLMLAIVILSAIVWTWLRLAPDRHSADEPPRLRAGAVAILALVFVQIYFGALVAGLRAGRIYTTWPEIDGAFVPAFDRLFFEQPWWRNFFDNMLTVQFSHRMTAYALTALAAWHLVDAVRTGSARAQRGALWLAVAVAAQVALGIVTLVNAAPIALALGHQALALVVLLAALAQTEALAVRRDAPSQALAFAPSR